MKKIQFLKFSLLSLFILSITYGCGSNKKVLKETKTAQAGVYAVNVPCSGDDFRTDFKKGLYRGSGTMNHSSQNVSKTTSLARAKNSLAGQLQTLVQSFITDYYSVIGSSETNANNEVRIKSNIEATVNKSVNSMRIMCDKLLINRNSNPPTYESYVTVEADIKKVFEDLNKSFSTDEELKIEYNYQKFKETFDKQMEKMSKG